MPTVLKREEGIALPMALSVLLMVSMLAAALLANAVQSSGSTNRDRDSKRALAAAEAGLRVASYRVGQLRPSSSECIDDAGVGGATIRVVTRGGECYSGADSQYATAETVGNRGQFTYIVSRPLQAGDLCGSLPGAPPADYRDLRCVTSTGEFNGVKRRIQARVSAALGQPFFAEAGMVARDLFETDNNINIGDSIGSNGQIAVRNNVTVTGAAKLGTINTPAPIVGNGSTIAGGTQYRATPWVLPAGDFAAASLPGANNNAAIPAAYFRDVAKTHFYLARDKTYMMPAGDYLFCSFEVEKNVQLQIPTTGLVRIFVDHYSRSGSPCSADATIPIQGRFILDAGVDVNAVAGKAENLEVYVNGTGNAVNTERVCGSSTYRDDVVLCNAVTFKGVLIARESTVRMRNGATVTGGIASKAVDINNGMTFIRSPAVAAKVFSVPTDVTRRAWLECRTEPVNPADPESGCS